MEGLEVRGKYSWGLDRHDCEVLDVQVKIVIEGRQVILGLLRDRLLFSDRVQCVF